MTKPSKRKPFPYFRGSFRRQHTPEEQKILDNAQQIRTLGKKRDRVCLELRQAVTTCELATKAGWPYNPDRLQKVFALLAEIEEIRAEAQKL